MDKLSFSAKWQQWIKGDLCSPMTSILVNGEAHGYFRASKGVRQGDPLSSGLFVLIMDILSFLITKLRNVNGLFGFAMDEDRGEGEVTHILFADDSLIFCDANADQVLNILSTLQYLGANGATNHRNILVFRWVIGLMQFRFGIRLLTNIKIGCRVGKEDFRLSELG
ncbi:unnamed protein product [Linum tenue]|uniref:Reverse transcriptase domain-containing protein n=1 Tax=Linum tenue TaxID=586396 RepID=A0AAV0L5V9_9ROSI|nr:unnamed protein product [Linum tenue]